MTGKKHKNNKSRWVEETPEKLSYICETLHNENMKLKDKLTKYKRAFEILKDTVDLKNGFWKEVETKGVVEMKYFFRVDTIFISFTKEEYELLEELISDE